MRNNVKFPKEILHYVLNYEVNFFCVFHRLPYILYFKYIITNAFQKNKMAKKLYVGNLPYEATEDQLKELFGQAGTVESANIIMDKFSGRSKGFGFVEMSSDEEAKKAIEILNGFKIGDRTIVVNEARPMTDRGPRQGGFGGRRNFDQ